MSAPAPRRRGGRGGGRGGRNRGAVASPVAAGGAQQRASPMMTGDQLLERQMEQARRSASQREARLRELDAQIAQMNAA